MTLAVDPTTITPEITPHNNLARGISPPILDVVYANNVQQIYKSTTKISLKVYDIST